MNTNGKNNKCMHCGTDIERITECSDNNPNLCESCESKADEFISSAFKEGLENPHIEDDFDSDTLFL